MLHTVTYFIKSGESKLFTPFIEFSKTKKKKRKKETHTS